MSPLTVSGVVARVSRRLHRSVLLATTLWTAVAVAVVLFLAWLWAGPDGWRQGSWGPLLLDLVLLAALAAAVPTLLWIRRRWLAEKRVARCLEDAAGLRPGTVVGSLELSRSLPPGVSKGLAAFAERGLLRSLERPDTHLGGALRTRISGWTRGALAGLALVTPVLVLLAIVTPDRTASAWSGLSSPVLLLSPPLLPPLGVEPGDGDVPRGEDAEVRVTAPGRERVTLHWQAAGDVPRSETLLLDAEERATYFFAAVTEPVAYWATAPDGARSQVFHLTPTDPLFVSDLRLELSFPAHTGRPPEEYRADIPALVVPIGTRVRVDGRASRPLREGALRLRDGERTQPLEVGGAAFSTSWVPRESGVYDWHFLDESGVPPELDPAPLDLTLVADSAPEVAFTYPATDTIVPMNLRQPLALEMRDDHGVASMELVAYRVRSGGQRGEPVVQRMDVGGAREAGARPVLDLAGMGLLPGDEVRYLARVTDNAPSPQTAETREWVLRMPGTTELRRGAQEQLEEVSRRMEELAGQAERSAEETRNLQRQVAAERSASQPRGRTPGGRTDSQEGVGFQQREDLRQSLERQQELAGEVDALREELQALADAMRETGLAEPGLRSDLNELQRLLERVTTPELRERLRDMAANLEGMDSRQAQEALRRLSEAQEEFRQRVEESLERFRRAAVEQDFRATTAEAEELARLERALAEAMREAGQPELRADQQADLERRAEDMESRTRELEQRLQQMGEEQAAGGVREGMERTAEARDAMSRAEQRSRAGQNQEAGEQAERAAAAMEQAARDLADARQEMADQRGEAVRQAFEDAAEEALALARRQSEIRDQMQGASSQEMSGLRGDVGAVLQGVRSITENVADAMQQSGAGGQEMSDRAGEAMAALERTVDAMDQRPGPGPSPTGAAESAVNALNQLALAAMVGAEQAGQGSGGQGDVTEQLEALAQQQGRLNNETGQIMPMQLGQQALQMQLEDVAQGQESVAGELGRLADEPGSEGVLGDLEALAQEARELAERLSGGRLDAETRERQERLFHRLLDAGRSLEKEDEFSSERESRTAEGVEARDVQPLSAEDVGAIRYRLPDAAALQRLAPAERQLVLEYFERLNREAPRPGTGSGGAQGPSERNQGGAR